MPLPLFRPLYKINVRLVYLHLISNSRQKLFLRQQAEKRYVMNIYLLGGGILVLIVVVIVIAIVVAKLRHAQRRKALEQILKRYHESRQALLRYVMLNRQCSEEVAYRRIATFVKKNVPLDEHSSIDRLLAHDRQSLLDSARSILALDPDEIDKI